MPGLEELTRDLRSHSDEVVNNAIRSSEGVAGLAGMIVKEERDAMRQSAMAQQAPQNPPTVREQMMGLPEVMPDMGNAPMEAIQGIGNPNLMAMNEAVMNTPRDEGEALAQGMRMGAGAVEEANRNAAMNAGIAPLPMEEDMFTAAEGGIIPYWEPELAAGASGATYMDSPMWDAEIPFIDKSVKQLAGDYGERAFERPVRTAFDTLAGLTLASKAPRLAAWGLEAGKTLAKSPLAKKIASGAAPVAAVGQLGYSMTEDDEAPGKEETTLSETSSVTSPVTDKGEGKGNGEGKGKGKGKGVVNTEFNKLAKVGNEELGTDFWSGDTVRKLMLFGGLNFAQGKSIGESLSEGMQLIITDKNLRDKLQLEKEQIEATKGYRDALVGIRADDAATKRALRYSMAMKREFDMLMSPEYRRVGLREVYKTAMDKLEDKEKVELGLRGGWIKDDLTLEEALKDDTALAYLNDLYTQSVKKDLYKKYGEEMDLILDAPEKNT